MTAKRREQLTLLGRVLFAAAAAVLVCAVIAAIFVGTSESKVLLYQDVQRENRGFLALGTLGVGVFGAGVLAGLGGILLAMVERPAEKD